MIRHGGQGGHSLFPLSLFLVGGIMRRSYWLVLLVFGLGLSTNGCKKDDPIEALDDCGTTQNEMKHGVLHAGDPTVVAVDVRGHGDCTTSYLLYFRWANLDKADTSSYPPPILPVFSPPAQSGTGVTPEKNGSLAQYPGRGWWVIQGAPTPLTAPQTTEFIIRASLPSGTDSVEVHETLFYH